MNNKKIYYLFSALLIPVILYFYFLEWKTGTIYGDDLSIYANYIKLHSFSEKINMSLAAEKYRPVSGVVFNFIAQLFQKNLDGYYYFNIAIQSINTIIFIFILNLFLRSYWLSFAFGLTVGLSRFSYYTISQLFNGGALEGLAITFFLLALYFILRVITQNETTVKEKKNGMLWAILFANLGMFTHERYVVVIFFILLLIAFYPTLKTLSLKLRIGLGFAAVSTIALNVVIKKFVYSVPFFVGTGGTNIEFSFSNAFSFLIDGLLSIAQINKGPQYLVGIEFAGLPAFNKALVLVVFFSLSIAIILFVLKIVIAGLRFCVAQVVEESALKPKENTPYLHTFIFLLVLFFLLIAPAIVTIRIEQRWLQASFCVFVILVVIALSRIPFKNSTAKYSLLLLFVAIFLFNDYIYLHRGGQNIYMSSAKRLAEFFKKGIDKNVLLPQTKNLFIVEKTRRPNDENEVIWSIGGGAFFDFYQGAGKNLIFIDSIYERSMNASDTTLSHFNKKTDQIIWVASDIVDLTDQYIKDSLKNFTY